MDEDNQYRKMDKWLGVLIWLGAGLFVLLTLDVLVFDNALVRSVFGY